MSFSKFLKDNTCFIVPNAIKEEILFYISENKLLYNLNFFTFEELQKNLYFDYDKKTIFLLMQEFSLSYNDSLMIIKSLYYINDINVDDPKIKQLQSIKRYLDKNNLLIYNQNFLNYLQSFNIVTTYSKTTFLKEKVFSLLDNITYLEAESLSFKKISEFSFIEDEVEYVAYNIAKLLEQNVNINNIKIVNVENEYKSFIKKIFNFYHIPINLNERYSLYDFKCVKEFIFNLKETNDLEKSLIIYKDKNSLQTPLILDIYNKIIMIMNELYFINDYSLNYLFIINIFKNEYLKQEKLNNCVKTISIDEMTFNDDYYFLVGFNSTVPHFLKDEEYVSDKLKEKLGYKTTTCINKHIKKYYINKLKGIKNITITYNESDYFNSYLVSSLIDDIKSEVVYNPKINKLVCYSKEYNEIKLAKYLDDYYKYGFKNDDLNLFLYNYKKDFYDSYDNKFTGLGKNKFMTMKEDILSLSYTSLDNFYKCSFKYYLDNILNEKESTFEIFIGELYHYVLSKTFEENFDFEREFNEYLKKRELNSKEEILLLKLKNILKHDIHILKSQIDSSDFKVISCEKKIVINKKSKASIYLSGYIDKIILTDDHNYGYVVDYKTGDPSISFDYLSNGLNMQLAIYMYLMNKSREYADVFLVGCYLQKILTDDLSKDSLTLEGYTYNDLDVIKRIDYNYCEDSFIEGLKIKKDGQLSNNKRLFNSNEFQNILIIVEEKINEAIDSIKNNDFKINPKLINGKNISCKYCNYKDVCYRKYKDFEEIGRKEGEENE